MHKMNGVAGATLLYGPTDPEPDLVAILQFLVDDLRAEGQRIAGLRLGPRSLRLRADGFDMALTLAAGPVPPASLTCVRRLSPTATDIPDLARARMIRQLREHSHALGFIVRQRDLRAAPPTPPGQTITRHGRRMLLPVFEAAPPALLIWQPGGLLFNASEFMAVDIDTLLAPPNIGGDLRIASRPRPPAHRPVTVVRPARPTPSTRPERAAQSSAGRLFGHPSSRHPRAAQRLEPAHHRVNTAMRHPPPAATTRPLRGQRIAVAALWSVLLPQLLGGWLPI